MNISTNKYLFRTYKKYLGNRLYWVFLLTLVAALMEGFGITLLLPLIEAADTGPANYDNTVSKMINSVLSFFGVAGSMGATLAFIAVVFLFKGLLKFGEGAYKGYLKAKLMKELKSKMFDAFNSMDYSYYIKRNTGHFINVINTQIVQTINSFNNYITFLTQAIMAMSYLFIAFLITWGFALMAVGIGFILLILFKTLNFYVSRLSRHAALEASNLNNFLIQTLQAFKYIASTGQNKHLRKGVMLSVHKLAGLDMKKSIAAAFTNALQEPVSVIIMVIIVAIQVLIMDAPVGPILVALMLFYRGLRAIIGVQSNWQATMNTLGSMEMVENEFKTMVNSLEADGDISIQPLSEFIEFRDISFSYQKHETPVIHHLNLTIPINNTIALAGDSGAGKTTMADILTLMLRPGRGDIYIDGVAGKDISRQSWRKQIGYVSQETVVFDDTIANNICLWQGDYDNNPETREKVHEAARKAYADIFINELPEGFDTMVGDRGVRLSGGQRQRLFIARELYKNPKLLILDEATSALDSESERYIQDSIDELKGQMTVVIIAHRLSTIKNADMIYVIDGGKIIEAGSFNELNLNKESRLKKMIDMQKV